MANAFRSCLLALLLCPLLLGAGCGGTSPRPKLDGSAAGGSEGQAGSPGSAGSGDETGGSGGSQGGSGGQGQGGSGGVGSGQGGAGGSGSGNAGTGGGGAGGSAMGGSGMGGGTGGSGTDGKLDTAASDVLGGRRPPARQQPRHRHLAGGHGPGHGHPARRGDLRRGHLSAVVATGRELPPDGRLHPADVRDAGEPLLRQSGQGARPGHGAGQHHRHHVREDRWDELLLDGYAVAGRRGRPDVVVKELAGTEVARVTITESTAISCAGGPQQTLNDSSCLPPFSLTECAAGDCQ